MSQTPHGPFEYVNQIISGKHDLMIDEITEKAYVPFLANRGLSYHSDCVLYANEMNRHPHLDKKLQYHFLLHAVRGRKRPFVKWMKPDISESLESLQRIYGYSREKAQQVLPLFSTEQLDLLRQMTDVGKQPSTPSSDSPKYK